MDFQKCGTFFQLTNNLSPKDIPVDNQLCLPLKAMMKNNPDMCKYEQKCWHYLAIWTKNSQLCDKIVIHPDVYKNYDKEGIRLTEEYTASSKAYCHSQILNLTTNCEEAIKSYEGIWITFKGKKYPYCS